MGLQQALQNIWSSDYVQKNPNKAYKVSYASEYAAVSAYLNDGPEPNWAGFSKLGQGLCEAEKHRRAEVIVVPPDPPPDPPPAGLGVDRATMLATGGKILRDDSSAQADPLTGLWGQLSNVAARCVHRSTGGDPRPKADGTPQGNTAYRELNIAPGDSWQGETAQRTELGRNTTTPYYTECQPGSVDGTFALADEGQHRIHFWSQRYHDNFIMSQNNWQLIMQNKQDQPYAANGPVDSAPALAINLYNNLLIIDNFWTNRWSTPAPVKNAWIRYALEAFYSKDPAKGWVRLYVDRDGDGDFLDANEMSPQIHCQTLANITSKGNSPRNVGDSLPSHMRLGIYRQQTYLSASTMDQDNVQVVG